MEGEKEDLLIIEKSRNPRRFKDNYVETLFLEWVSNQKGSVTTENMTRQLNIIK